MSKLREAATEVQQEETAMTNQDIRNAIAINNQAIKAANRRAKALDVASRRMGRLAHELSGKARLAESPELDEAATIISTKAKELMAECDAEWATAHQLVEVGRQLVDKLAPAMAAA